MPNKHVQITKITSPTPVNKTFLSDGSKISNANITQGTTKKISFSSLEELDEILNNLTIYQAITTGITDEIECILTTASKVTTGNIARTKEYFHTHEYSIVLFDYDSSKEGFKIESQEHFVEVLREIDPELNYCDILVRAGSSNGIRKDGVLLKDDLSLHAYVMIKNASDEKLNEWKAYLNDRVWELGYGHIEISSSGSIMRRGVLDLSVMSSERLIFESAPTLSAGITKDILPSFIAKAKS